MRKKVKFIIIFIILLFTSISFPHYTVNAKIEGPQEIERGGRTVSGIVGTLSPSNVDETDFTDFQITIGYVLSFLQIVSAFTCVIMIAFLGFKMVLEPSADAKKEIKGKFLPIVLGTAIVFGATAIAKFIIGAVA